MSSRYTHKNIADVADAAERFGYSETHESRFAMNDFQAERTGFSLHSIKPGKRMPFAHRHDEAEEVYFVVAGSGRMKLDDDVVELAPRDAVRVAPGVTRTFEAGDEGLEVLVFGAHHAGDGEVIHGWWSD